MHFWDSAFLPDIGLCMAMRVVRKRITKEDRLVGVRFIKIVDGKDNEPKH